MSKDKKYKNRGFTLAEVLITLSIIGVIAAILFPSILANYNERTLKAKRQALFGRMSQAMGEMASQFRNYGSIGNRSLTEDDPDDYSPNCSTNLLDCSDTGSALKFINEGLSKVYKIAAVCDNESLAACDIPEHITRADGTMFSLRENGKKLSTFNPQTLEHTIQSLPYDLDSAAFKTKNGESILLFYNPNCQGKMFSTSGYDAYSEAVMCVNMVYDLNGGKNKPNRVGEDIGFMTSFYNDSPYVVSARPYDPNTTYVLDSTVTAETTTPKSLYSTKTFREAKSLCSSFGDNVGLPSYEELMSMQINRELWFPKDSMEPAYYYFNNVLKNGKGTWAWSSTMNNLTQVWVVWLSPRDEETRQRLYARVFNVPRADDPEDDTTTDNNAIALCVYKD